MSGKRCIFTLAQNNTFSSILSPSLAPSLPSLTSHKTHPPLLVTILLAPLFHNHRPATGNANEAGEATTTTEDRGRLLCFSSSRREGGREGGRGCFLRWFPSSFGPLLMSSWCLAREEWRACRSWVRRVTLPWRRSKAALPFSFCSSLSLTCWCV